ncbi:DUF4373 domain-containing protein [uncultured Ruminococcus sp.]|uniref:DUF4373 domain-containing protein n=1 Tax=uncultured Ruminococcus sp. TaxID=165186 RepID=UPI0025DD0A8F|nr:DUF4373 domain-containing protein [uncultured Ruminococcus sp.]
MARPAKVGLDYFPLDCVLDDKIELIEAEFGLTGFAVVVKLFQKIYGEQGYYCEWTKEVALLFARKCGVGGNVVSEIVASALKRGIFNNDLFNRYEILTSRGIQKRYFEAVSRRKQIEVKNEYLLIKVAQYSKNTDNNSDNVDINSINDVKSTQSKVKESKVKESKVKERKRSCRSALSAYGSFNNVLLSDNELEQLKQRYPNSYKDKIERLSVYMESSGTVYKNHFAKIVEWLNKDKDEQKAIENKAIKSYDLDELDKIDTLDNF